MEEIEVSQSPTNLAACIPRWMNTRHCLAFQHVLQYTLIQLKTPNFLQNKEKGLEEIKVSQSLTKSCCQYSKIDEYKSLFGLPTCTPVHFDSAQDSQLPANKEKGLEEIEVSQSPTKSCCLYSKMDKYKSMFGLPTCTPVRLHSAQDSQLLANKEKGLEEIEVSPSLTNELFMLLILSGSQCLAGVVPRDSQSCSMLEGFHQNSSMEDDEPLKPNSLGYDLFLYKANNEPRRCMSCSQVSRPVLHSS